MHGRDYFAIFATARNLKEMSDRILNIRTVTEYNDMLGVETRHPLVSVIDLYKARPMRHMRHTFSFYAVYLKDEKNCEITYGRQKYDYCSGSVVCLAPGQVIGIEDTGETFQPKGYALLFHPDITHGTSLGQAMKEYTFFSYNVNEALHLSEGERSTFIDCLKKIDEEFSHQTDRLSKRLISKNIELLLDYCLRFYDRQFITRRQGNSSILSRFDSLLDDYINSSRMGLEGIPSVRLCAGQLCLSPNYFGDLIKRETGKTPQEHIRSRVIEAVKEQLMATDKSLSEIAYAMGFEYPQHMTRMFKKETGMSPNEYRKSKE